MTYQKVAGRVWLWSEATPPSTRAPASRPARVATPRLLRTEAWWWTGPWSALPGAIGLGIVAVPNAASRFGPEFVLPPAVALGLVITVAGIFFVAELGNRWCRDDPEAPEVLASVWATIGLLFVLFALRMFVEDDFSVAGGCLAVAAAHGVAAGRATVAVTRLVQRKEAGT